MPPILSLDVFRLRSRTKQLPVPLSPSSEDDSDLSSCPPEQQRIVHADSRRSTTDRHVRGANPAKPVTSPDVLVPAGVVVRMPRTDRKASKANLVSLANTTHAATAASPSGKPPAPPSIFSDGTADNSNTSTKANAACDITAHDTTPSSTNNNITTAAVTTSLARKTTLLRRVTSKLHIAIPSSKSHPHRSPSAAASPSSPSPPVAKDANTRKRVPSQKQKQPRVSDSRLFLSPASPTLPNTFISREHREAALRERGLLPPKDLSEQEREQDARLPVVPAHLRTTAADPVAMGAADSGMSMADKIKEEWRALNRDAPPKPNAEDDHSLPAAGAHTAAVVLPPSVNSADVVTSSTEKRASLDREGPETLLSGQGNVELSSPLHSQAPASTTPPRSVCAKDPLFLSTSPTQGLQTSSSLVAGAPRPSISSSVPPLSTSSQLEVLHEEEDPDGPFTPPPSATAPKVHVAQSQGRPLTRPGIVISTAIDAYIGAGGELSPTQTMVESPYQCPSSLSGCNGCGDSWLDVPSDRDDLRRRSGLHTCAEEPEDGSSPFSHRPPVRRHTSDACPPLQGRGGRGRLQSPSTYSRCASTAASTSLSPVSPITSSSLSPTTTVASRSTSVSRTRSRLGKASFTNLRRTVSTSLRSFSSSSNLAAANSRRASSDAGSNADGEVRLRARPLVSPTIHSRASIMFEMHAVEDPESRRLCEMAFLD